MLEQSFIVTFQEGFKIYVCEAYFRFLILTRTLSGQLLSFQVGRRLKNFTFFMQ